MGLVIIKEAVVRRYGMRRASGLEAVKNLEI